MALDVTVGGAGAVSYIAAAAAKTWIANFPWSTKFANETDAVVEQYLQQAAELMQSRPWKGNRVTEIQALDWPRELVINPDFPTVEYATNVIPDRVWKGQVTWAMFLYKFAVDPTVPSVTEGYDEVEVGPIRVRSKGSGGATRSFSKVPDQTTFITQRLAMPPQVHRYLKSLMQSSKGWTQLNRVS